MWDVWYDKEPDCYKYTVNSRTQCKDISFFHRDTPAELLKWPTKPYSTTEDPIMVQWMDIETISNSRF